MVLGSLAIVGLFLSSIATANIFQQSRFKHRLLLVDTSQSVSRETIDKAIAQSSEYLVDRKLIIIVKHAESAEVIWGHVDINYKVDFKTITRVLDGQTAVLIGLDGGIKNDYQNFESLNVFDDIDRMPMRRAELRKNNSLTPIRF